MEYPLLAALNSKNIGEVYVSTDSSKIKEITLKHKANVIDRPDYLCTKEALGEDAYVHGYNYIKNELKKEVELVVLLFCNGPTVLPELIDEGITALRKDKKLDSAVRRA